MNSSQVLVTREQNFHKSSQRRCLDATLISLEKRMFLGKENYYFQQRSFCSRFANMLMFCFNFYIKCHYKEDR